MSCVIDQMPVTRLLSRIIQERDRVRSDIRSSREIRGSAYDGQSEVCRVSERTA